MQDKQKVEKASPKERKSERSENGKRRNGKNPDRTRGGRGFNNGKGKRKKAKTGRTPGLK